VSQGSIPIGCRRPNRRHRVAARPGDQCPVEQTASAAPAMLILVARNRHHAYPNSSSPGFRPRGRRRGSQRRASADPPSRVARLGYASGAVSFFTCWGKRLGASDDQSAPEHRRSPVVGCGRARRDPGRRRHDSHERRHQHGHPQSRRPHRPAAIDTGHIGRARASSPARSGVRSRHAKPCLYASATRRVPHREVEPDGVPGPIARTLSSAREPAPHLDRSQVRVAKF